ncbi:hypothetical protein DH2020_035258 [Rehmannia glutinosa]|uniref:B box-type domain-containing protein n=1 Tax=Rehmannia glutinosa TaxID=99300 RepID=A0ABR0V975_REHGL
MKIQCDVCEKDEASVFCVADEASLCAACDHRVHHANKLAGKHQRFSLHHPSPKQSPVCDICQERRAFLFCQQDRAILCRECDIPIHKANEHTQKHTRFLLTGIKLSATSSLYSESPSSAAESPSSSLTNSKSSNSNIKSQDLKIIQPVCLNPPSSTPSTAKGTTVQSTPEKSNNNVELMNGGNLNGSVSASSISEYLIEMLPGWHVEDFLDSSSTSPSPIGFSKNGENDLLPFWDADIQSNIMSVFPTEKMGISVPQVHPPLQQTQNQSYEMTFGFGNGFMENTKEITTYNNMKSSRKRSDHDNSFAVPQISPPSTVSKKSRSFW